MRRCSQNLLGENVNKKIHYIVVTHMEKIKLKTGGKKSRVGKKRDLLFFPEYPTPGKFKGKRKMNLCYLWKSRKMLRVNHKKTKGYIDDLRKTLSWYCMIINWVFPSKVMCFLCCLCIEYGNKRKCRFPLPRRWYSLHRVICFHLFLAPLKTFPVKKRMKVLNEKRIA